MLGKLVNRVVRYALRADVDRLRSFALSLARSDVGVGCEYFSWVGEFGRWWRNICGCAIRFEWILHCLRLRAGRVLAFARDWLLLCWRARRFPGSEHVFGDASPKAKP